MKRVNHSFYLAARSLFLSFSYVLFSVFFHSTEGIGQEHITRKDLTDSYYKVNQERLLIQRQANIYISMDASYNACLTRSATASKCDAELKKVSELIERSRLLGAAKISPTPDTTVTNNINIQQNTVIVDRYNPFPTKIPPTPYFEKTPKNQFTPKHGFTPENQFQGGDGFQR